MRRGKTIVARVRRGRARVTVWVTHFYKIKHAYYFAFGSRTLHIYYFLVAIHHPEDKIGEGIHIASMYHTSHYNIYK